MAACVSITFLSAIPCLATPSRIFLVDDVYECVDYLNALCTLTSPSRAAWGKTEFKRMSQNRGVFSVSPLPAAQNLFSSFAMKQSSSEVNISSATKKITRLIRDPRVSYHVHKIPRISPYPEPDKSSLHIHILNVSSGQYHLRLGSNFDLMAIKQWLVFRGPILDMSVFLQFMY